MTNSHDLVAQERLEQVTTARLAADEPLDADARELRDAWCALSELLEASAADVPLPALDVLVDRPAESPRRPRVAVMPWLAALAATLLLAAAGWSVWYFAPVHPGPHVVAVERPKHAAPTVVPETAPSQSPDSRPASVTKDNDAALAWDDTFDEQLDQAWLCARQLQDGGSTLDTWHDSMAGSVNKLQQELNSGEAL